MSVVSLRNEGDVAVITVDNPPVNALKHEVRAGLLDAFKKAGADANVKAIVLNCAGRTFIAGADITEFGKPPKEPGLSEVIATIENVQKPTVAAIHGTALGGGLETALGCHFRVAVATAKVGLPEIKLGILPGAGGTQRLPRLAGMEKAFPMIISGDPISAKDALAHGIVDEIIDGDLLAGAIAFAKKKVAEGAKLVRVRDREEKIADLKANPDKFNDIIAANSKKNRGEEAPVVTTEVLRGAITKSFDEGLKGEREGFMKLVVGDQSKAKRHYFFAEREAAKVPDMSKDVKPKTVKKAGVIGAGTMGGGITMNFANAGIPVTIVEMTEEALNRGLGIIRKNYENTMRRGGISQADLDKRMSLIKGSTDFNDLSDADLVIEAVFEEMPIKKEVFAKLEKVTRPDTILATNTSYLNVDEIAATTGRVPNVLGMHFFSPANVMKLLEIVRGKNTSDEALATAIDVARKINKVPTIVGVCHGFVGNRMLKARGIEAESLLLEGALPQEVDAATTGFGFPMGPFAMSDLAGLDIGWRIRKAMGQKSEIFDSLCELGRYGQKTGSGVYRYEGGSRTPIPDEVTEQIIVNASKNAGIKRRPISQQEIGERLIFSMINEGARILEEGIAMRPSDIDVVYVNGYGWPVWQGGPMFYADLVGLPYIVEKLEGYAKESGNEHLQPAALLKRLAAEGRGFSSLGVSPIKKAA
ncbi:fatty acid oxidation complex subunit alpha [Variibacter gotjawalensis]|uniref:Fatty acid oxidation complex subunit alpha n=2 Tax=Variibacter gotjawalensis TaxID=1333996 RepID=A0A0S3PWR7_9BRAD|nr:3-hydroxyacyl-CoA dehydrogenase NAD-binding domain-containing protein [Variibacter gotjawalensis]NIK46193.1 3-hydroxyacyl-CoA dehydrogenase [Variibacter gotjawalensis]RZS48110.1 short chain enoyl-CoA hydratase /3-hydroxyacyl-CoA dehydrogenase [Variibacter gotjawalensis]BAT60367.1 fatty acid oxidation complex subunit alpha [Variibacter gotjawalensis]